MWVIVEKRRNQLIKLHLLLGLRKTPWRKKSLINCGDMKKKNSWHIFSASFCPLPFVLCVWLQLHHRNQCFIAQITKLIFYVVSKKPLVFPRASLSVSRSFAPLNTSRCSALQGERFHPRSHFSVFPSCTGCTGGESGPTAAHTHTHVQTQHYTVTVLLSLLCVFSLFPWTKIQDNLHNVDLDFSCFCFFSQKGQKLFVKTVTQFAETMHPIRRLWVKLFPREGREEG